MQDDAHRSQSRGPWNRRWRLCVTTFVICCTAGMAYTFLRPAVYRSTATLNVSQRTPSSGRSPNDGTAEQGINLVAVQRHVVSDPAMISQVFRRFVEHLQSEEFKRRDGTVPDFAEVEAMLSARRRGRIKNHFGTIAPRLGTVANLALGDKSTSHGACPDTVALQTQSKRPVVISFVQFATHVLRREAPVAFRTDRATTTFLNIWQRGLLNERDLGREPHL